MQNYWNFCKTTTTGIQNTSRTRVLFLLWLIWPTSSLPSHHSNCQMQGGGLSVIKAEEKMSAFQRKLQLWLQRLEKDNFASFPLLDEIVSNSDTAINDEESNNEWQRFKPVFADHLLKFQRLFKNYFSNQRQYPAWIRQSFVLTLQLHIQTIDTQMTSLSFRKARLKKLAFYTTNLNIFWCQQMESCPCIAKVTLEVLTSFIRILV